MISKTKKSIIPETSFKNQRALSTNRVFLFVLPNALFTAMLGMMVTFTLIFYVSVLGIPVIIFGIIYSLGLFIYAFMCIIWGFLADKYGKKKVLWISGILMAIVFTSVWTAPVPSKNETFGSIYIPTILWFIVFSVVFRIMSAAFQSIFYSLLLDVSTSEQNRMKIAMINTFMSTIGFVVGMIIPFTITGVATNNLQKDKTQLYYPASSTGQTIYFSIVIFSLVLSIIFFISFILMNTKIQIPSIARENIHSFRLMASHLAKPFRDKNYRLWLLCFLLFWLPFVAFQYLFLNVVTYLLSFRGIEFFLFIGLGVFIVFISIFLWQIFTKKYGIKKTMMLCLISSSAVFAFHFILFIPMPYIIFLILEIILLYFLLFELVGIMGIPLVLMSNLIEQAKTSQKKDLSGAYAGAFVTTASIGSGIAMIFISVFLGLYGIDNPISYGFIFTVGSILIFISFIIFQKIEVKN